MTASILVTWQVGRAGLQSRRLRRHDELGPLGPEATLPQGLKPHNDKPFHGGAKAPPFPALPIMTRTFAGKP
ncbi:hypothetical protein SBA2_350030 [Acidobacteriia bacterium SbA2]|nr:hypothetical protein SBA2_350030 [Acidobacteriia bacterium SbA2]